MRTEIEIKESRDSAQRVRASFGGEGKRGKENDDVNNKQEKPFNLSSIGKTYYTFVLFVAIIYLTLNDNHVATPLGN